MFRIMVDWWSVVWELKVNMSCESVVVCCKEYVLGLWNGLNNSTRAYYKRTWKFGSFFVYQTPKWSELDSENFKCPWNIENTTCNTFEFRWKFKTKLPMSHAVCSYGMFIVLFTSISVRRSRVSVFGERTSTGMGWNYFWDICVYTFPVQDLL